MPNVVITNKSIEDWHRLLDHVILNHDDASINTCHLEFVNYFNCEKHKVNAWIFHVLLVCNVKELKISIRFGDEFNRVIISKHLRKLELNSLKLKDNFVDFISCAFDNFVDFISCAFLEELQMSYCIIPGSWTPLFESMPYLVSIAMIFNNMCMYSNFWDCGDEACEGCYDIGDHKNGSLLC
uniref:Uncharacterized protein n=1 Tax=Oryza punctata TaxID=4537 RepID=A0A0E0L9I4_ORYPU